MARFYGTKTIRLDGIPGKSSAFVDYMLDPLMHDVCRHVLRPNCADYLLNVAQLIEIGPGEDAQRLHRDEGCSTAMSSAGCAPAKTCF